LRRLACLISLFLLSATMCAEETVFRDVQFPSSKGQLTNATLKFSDESKLVEARLSDGRVVTVMYSQIDTISYEYTKKHRLKQGLALGMLSPGTGIIVAFTKSKNHWLEIDFHDQNAPSALVLKLDKRDYKKVCDAAKAHTGKDVVVAGKTDTKSLKAKIKD
jgi:hypothetical protein